MAKGKDFEREISKDMSLWLTCGNDQDCIWYTKSSGGRATRRVKSKQTASKYDHGDLGPDGSTLEWFFDLFSIELKTGYGSKRKKGAIQLWSALDLLDSQQTLPTFYDFWQQACTDADASEREPMLIFRRNRRLPCIAMRQQVFNIFIGNKEVEFDTINVQLNGYPYSIICCNIRYFYDHTWGCVNKQSFTLKMKRVMTLNKRN